MGVERGVAGGVRVREVGLLVGGEHVEVVAPALLQVRQGEAGLAAQADYLRTRNFYRVESDKLW